MSRILQMTIIVVAICASAAGLAQHAPPSAGSDAELIESARKQGRVPVIVRFRVPAELMSAGADPLALANSVQAARERILSAVPTGLEVVQRFEFAPMFSAWVTEEGLQTLFRDPNISGQIESVSPDRIERPHLDDSTRLIDAELAWRYSKGRDWIVAIIDSGINPDHPMFQPAQKISDEEACFCREGCPNGQPSQTGRGAARSMAFHGSHVAGIAAGKEVQHEGRTLSGVAPEATILPINVFCGDDNAWVSDTARALDHVFGVSVRGGRVAAANMSLGGRRIFRHYCDDDERITSVGSSQAET